MFRADLDDATASANASCPASSITNTSTGASFICGEAKNQGVPATRLYLALAAAALEPGYLTPTRGPTCDLFDTFLLAHRSSSCPFSSNTE